MNVAINHPTNRPNFTAVYIGQVTVYFSYKTPVGFHTWEQGTVVRENDWGPTTGKHLNWIDGGNKKDRLSSEVFQYALTLALPQGVTV